MTLAQSCEYTKTHSTVYFKWVNFTVYELDLNFSNYKKKQKKKYQVTWQFSRSFQRPAGQERTDTFTHTPPIMPKNEPKNRWTYSLKKQKSYLPKVCGTHNFQMWFWLVSNPGGGTVTMAGEEDSMSAVSPWVRHPGLEQPGREEQYCVLFQGLWLKSNRGEQLSQQNHREFRGLNPAVHPPLAPMRQSLKLHTQFLHLKKWTWNCGLKSPDRLPHRLSSSSAFRTQRVNGVNQVKELT